MMEVTTEYRTIFAQEAREHLEEWESALLSLEHNMGDQEPVHQMFRAIHTLKGSAGFIGFEKLQRVTHVLESALQNVRDGAATLDSPTVELLFQGLDLCTRMVQSFTAGTDFEEDIEGFLQSLWQSTGEVRQEPVPAEPRPAETDPVAARTAEAACGSGTAAPGSARRYRLRLLIKSSGREIFLRTFLIRSRLSAIGTVVSEYPAPETLGAGAEGNLAFTVIVDTDAAQEALREALNVDQVEITGLEETGDGEASPASSQADSPQAAASAAGPGNQSRTGIRDAKVNEVVRVSVERLDTLLNLVGELVIENSGFVSIAQRLKDSYGKRDLIIDLEEKTENLAKITRDLQDGIMKVRMLPVNNVFSRFHRVVRDLAKDRKKEITLDVFGEETEIDKKVMDRIGDPLVHLIRNAADHGIEAREERLAAGKSPVGHIRLGAYQDGDHICIEVADDGKGLDKEAVLSKAVEKGLVRQEQASSLSDEQLLSMIFLPGFSTAKVVSEVSGRGVGMDVVKRAIEGMGGSIRIRSSVGRGTTVTISLPLTMAIIPAVLVEVDGSTLAVPLSSVKEVLRAGREEMDSMGTRPVIRLRDEVLAVAHLREALELGGNGSATSRGESRTPIVIVDYEDKKIGLAVDRVLGTGEIVIKSLSRHYREIQGLIGASILGNGKIALIVDVEALVRRYHHLDSDERAFGDGGIFQVHGRGGAAPAPAMEGPSGEVSGPETSADCASDAAEAETAPAEHRDGEAETAGEKDRSGALGDELSTARGLLLEEIHNAGAIQASISLSQLIRREVRVSFPESQIVRLDQVAELLGGEELPVGGVYVGIRGELEGGVLMVLHTESMFRFHDRLHGRSPGTCTALEEVDMSAISELGNIISAAFMNAISDGARLRVKSEPPEITVDMCQPAIDAVLARFNRTGDEILLTRAMVYCADGPEVVCHLLLFLEPESLAKLLGALAGSTP